MFHVFGSSVSPASSQPLEYCGLEHVKALFSSAYRLRSRKFAFAVQVRACADPLRSSLPTRELIPAQTSLRQTSGRNEPAPVFAMILGGSPPDWRRAFCRDREL